MGPKKILPSIVMFTIPSMLQWSIYISNYSIQVGIILLACASVILLQKLEYLFFICIIAACAVVLSITNSSNGMLILIMWFTGLLGGLAMNLNSKQKTTKKNLLLGLFLFALLLSSLFLFSSYNVLQNQASIINRTFNLQLSVPSIIGLLIISSSFLVFIRIQLSNNIQKILRDFSEKSKSYSNNAHKLFNSHRYH